MPMFPNASKVAHKVAATQLLIASALEMEFMNHLNEIHPHHYAGTRTEWLNDYVREDYLPSDEELDAREDYSNAMDDYNYVGSPMHY